MGALLNALVSRLGKSDAIRYQVLSHIFIARNHNLIKSSYEQYLVNSSTASTEEQRNKNKTRDNPKKQTKEGEEQQVTKNDSEAREPQDWDWRGFPTLWRYFALYNFVSTTLCIWVTVRALFLDQLAALASPLSWWLFELPGHCLVPGRAALPLGVSQLFAALLSCFHLSWRYFQARAKRNRLLTMVVFLLVSERDLEHFYCLLEDDSQDSQDADPEVVRLLRQVTCYQVHVSHGGGGGTDPEGPKTVISSSKLRPNRTRETRRILTRCTATVSIATLTFFGLVSLIFGVPILLFIASDYRYAHMYPSCYSRQLDEQLARGALTLWPLTFNTTLKSHHHLLSGLFDLLESGIICLESLLALVFVPALCYLLNYDLLLYSGQLERKIKVLTMRNLIFERTNNSNCYQDNNPDQYPRFLRKSIPRIFRDEQNSLGTRCQDRPKEYYDFFQNTTKRLLQVESCISRQLERDLNELQHELYDFFHQVKRVDLLVGDTLTMTIITWIGSCAFANYNLLVYDASSLTTIVKFVFFLGFFVVASATYYLLELRRRCTRTYQLLLSLMASDRAHKRRRTFIRILDFFLEQDSTTYHLFRAHAYKPTTFIAIIGWSFSSFFVVFTLFGERSLAGHGGHGGGGT